MSESIPAPLNPTAGVDGAERMMIDLEIADLVEAARSDRRREAWRTLGAYVATGTVSVPILLTEIPLFARLVFAAILIGSTVMLVLQALGIYPPREPHLKVPGHDTGFLLPTRASAPLPPTQRTTLFNPFGGTTLSDFAVAPLGSELFAVADIPDRPDAELCYRDVVHLRELSDGTHVLLRIDARGGWRRHDASVAPRFFDSKRCQRLLEGVSERGGFWSHAEGTLTVVMPPTRLSHFDSELQRALEDFATAPAP